MGSEMGDEGHAKKTPSAQLQVQIGSQKEKGENVSEQEIIKIIEGLQDEMLNTKERVARELEVMEEKLYLAKIALREKIMSSQDRDMENTYPGLVKD